MSYTRLNLKIAVHDALKNGHKLTRSERDTLINRFEDCRYMKTEHPDALHAYRMQCIRLEGALEFIADAGRITIEQEEALVRLLDGISAGAD